MAHSSAWALQPELYLIAITALLQRDLNGGQTTLDQRSAVVRLPSCGRRAVQTQEVTEDPVIAADSFTYERSAIAAWLRSHDTSPMVQSFLPELPSFAWCSSAYMGVQAARLYHSASTAQGVS